MRGIIRYDLTTGSTQHHAINIPDQNSEPVFVPRMAASSEDDGWLVFSDYKADKQTNEIRKEFRQRKSPLVSASRLLPNCQSIRAWLSEKLKQTSVP